MTSLQMSNFFQFQLSILKPFRHASIAASEWEGSTSSITVISTMESTLRFRSHRNMGQKFVRPLPLFPALLKFCSVSDRV